MESDGDDASSVERSAMRTQQVRTEHCARQFLDEQRYAVGLGDHLIDYALGQSLGRHLHRQFERVLGREVLELPLLDVRLICPRVARIPDER